MLSHAADTLSAAPASNAEAAAEVPFRVARIGHVVLMVEDLARSIEFYTRVLGFTVTETYPDDMVAGGMAFLRFGEDHHDIALIGCGPGRSRKRELNHLAFAVATIDELFRARDHLERNGVKIDGEGRRRAGCQISIDFRDPDGHALELYWGVDRIPAGGVARPSSEWVQTRTLEDAVDRAPAGQDTTMADPGLRRDHRAH